MGVETPYPLIAMNTAVPDGGPPAADRVLKSVPIETTLPRRAPERPRVGELSDYHDY